MCILTSFIRPFKKHPAFIGKNMEKYYTDINSNKAPRVIKSQLKLIKALAEGRTLKETADMLDISYYNLQKRTQLLYKKFKVHNRAALITKALKFKIIPSSDIKKHFRLRFTNKLDSNRTNLKLKSDLTELEINYLKLAASGAIKKEIIKQLNLINMHFCNFLLAEICSKLNARNITEATTKAIRLNVI